MSPLRGFGVVYFCFGWDDVPTLCYNPPSVDRKIFCYHLKTKNVVSSEDKQKEKLWIAIIIRR